MSCSILEAMASGLPVVATDVGGNHELVEDGRTGFLVPAHDTDALSRRLRDLVENAELRRELGQAGRKRARECFALEQMFERYLAIYDGLLGPSGTKTG